MKKTVIKTTAPKKRNPIAMDVRLSGLYKMKVIPNRKKILKKFDIRKYEY